MPSWGHPPPPASITQQLQEPGEALGIAMVLLGWGCFGLLFKSWDYYLILITYF